MSATTHVIRVAATCDVVTVARSTARDRSLSFQARGMLLALLAMGEGAETSPDALVAESPAGRDAVYRIIAELKTAGYVERRPERDPLGRAVRWVTEVFETPRSEDQEAARPDRAEPDTVKPEVGATSVSQATAKPDRAKPEVARRASAAAPPTRVVSSPPSEETKDQEHQSSGAKAPSDCSAALPPKASRARARAKVGLLYGDLFVAVRSACRLGSGGLGKVDGRLVSDAAKDLEHIGATPADVEAAMPRWYAEDWRGKKGQPPTPTQLVTWVTQCRATPAGSPTTTHPTGDGSEDLAKWGDIFVAHAAMDKEARR